MTGKIDFKHIANELLARSDSFVASLLPAGHREGDEWVIGDLDGNPGDSCKVNLHTGRWSDFATGEAGGDLLSLVKEVKGFKTMYEAAQWVTSSNNDTPRLNKSARPKANFKQANTDHFQPMLPSADQCPTNFANVEHYKHGKADAHWVYRDINGHPIGAVYRFNTPNGGKEVFPYNYGTTKEHGKKWYWKQRPKDRPLYGLERLKLEGGVIIPEGEKSADAAFELFEGKVPVVSWPGGGKALKKVDWSPLKGRSVIIIADGDYPNDKTGKIAGYETTKQLCTLLAPIADSIRFVLTEPVDGIDGWDAADAQAAGWSGQQYSEWIEKHAQLYEVSANDSTDDVSLPLITISGGGLSEEASLSEEALIAAKLPFYQRDVNLVRPIMAITEGADDTTTKTPRLIDIDSDYLVDCLCRSAKYEKYDGVLKGMKRINPPKNIAHTILARKGEWRFPSISGVINIPILSKDGTIRSTAGYDPESHLVLLDPIELPSIPDKCTKEDAIAAIKLLEDLLKDFPFVDEISKSVAIAMLLTSVTRGSYPTAPMFGVTASTAGTGKSFLVDVCSMIANGYPCPVISTGKNEEEAEKRLGSALLAGFPLISIDNVTCDLKGSFLCQATERQIFTIRVLGKSKTVTIQARSTIFATGNNLTIVEDMARRSLLCRLEANCERPEEREFDSDPLLKVAQNRAQYLAACYTVIKAFIDAGKPIIAKPLGSYNGWSSSVRSALIWLGYEDPAKSREEIRSQDPTLSASTEALFLIHEILGANKFKAKDIIDNITHFSTDKYKELNEALLCAINERELNSRNLGRWFSSICNRPLSGYRLRGTKPKNKHTRQWWVEQNAEHAVNCGNDDIPF